MDEFDFNHYMSGGLAVRIKLNKILHLNEDGLNWLLLEKQKKDESSLAGISELVGYVTKFPGYYEKEDNLSLSPFPPEFQGGRIMGNIKVSLNYVTDVKSVVESDISRLVSR